MAIKSSLFWQVTSYNRVLYSVVSIFSCFPLDLCYFKLFMACLGGLAGRRDILRSRLTVVSWLNPKDSPISSQKADVAKKRVSFTFPGDIDTVGDGFLLIKCHLWRFQISFIGYCVNASGRAGHVALVCKLHLLSYP